MSEHVFSSKTDFERAIEKGITLVDFNAPWCGPCRAQEPILDEIERTFEGKATVAKIDIDQNQDVAVQLGIQSIPTLIAFKEGKEITRLIGLQDAGTIDRVLSELLE